MLRSDGDTDHAGDVESRRSTSGGIVALQAPGRRSRGRADWLSKEQKVPAISTAGAEVVGAVEVVRKAAYPALALTEEVLARGVCCRSRAPVPTSS